MATKLGRHYLSVGELIDALPAHSRDAEVHFARDYVNTIIYVSHDAWPEWVRVWDDAEEAQR